MISIPKRLADLGVLIHIKSCPNTYRINVQIGVPSGWIVPTLDTLNQPNPSFRFGYDVVVQRVESKSGDNLTLITQDIQAINEALEILARPGFISPSRNHQKGDKSNPPVDPILDDLL